MRLQEIAFCKYSSRCIKRASIGLTTYIYIYISHTHTLYSDISNCEVVTAWAGGCTWNEALQISGSAPGDLARILSRSLDAVRQLGNLPYVPVRRFDMTSAPRGIHPEIRRLCREAARAINRYPVKDPLAFESGEEKNEEDDLDVDSESDDESLTAVEP